MASVVRGPKDFWTGLIYVALGGAMLWYGQEYKVGSAGRMGPGYFPKALATLLVGLGLISIVRSFVTKGEPITRIGWKQLALILLACLAFALLLPRAGVVVALMALCLISAAASKEFRFDWIATAGLLVLISFCVLVFVKGLGVPMPITGTWLKPYITTPWLQ